MADDRRSSADCYAGLHARDFAGDRPLALPSDESLATLSQGVDALLPRKISNGAWSLLADGTPSDGIQDGVSLVRLLCSSAAAYEAEWNATHPEEVEDDWVNDTGDPATDPILSPSILEEDEP